MADNELQHIMHTLHHNLTHHDYTQSPTLLSRAKRLLLTLNALTPTPTTSPHALHLARETLELGALLSIRLQDPDSFTRYFQQLAPFYDLPSSTLSRDKSQQSKVTGLYLLLLLTKGDYAGFHTTLEHLMVGGSHREGVEKDRFISYPVKLEQWLMEGAYDKVWEATEREKVPSEEYGVFTPILTNTIRFEIASCSEKAYTSLPLSNAKSLLFLQSEGAVVEFARERQWTVRDGRIWFAAEGSADDEAARKQAEVLAASRPVIESTIGYARELETIV